MTEKRTIPPGLVAGHNERLRRVAQLGIPGPAEGQTFAAWYRQNCGHAPSRRSPSSTNAFTADRYGDYPTNLRPVTLPVVTLVLIEPVEGGER